MRSLRTWAGKSQFEYSGSVREGVSLRFGNQNRAMVSADQFRSMLAAFRGRTVPVGTSRDDPPAGSVGEWLQSHVTRVAIASYVGAILVDEGYAERLGSDIHFFAGTEE